MLTISINNQRLQLETPVPIATLVQDWRTTFPDNAYAVALNGEFLPKSQHPHTFVKQDDCIDIVTPVGGG